MASLAGAEPVTEVRTALDGDEALVAWERFVIEVYNISEIAAAQLEERVIGPGGYSAIQISRKTTAGSAPETCLRLEAHLNLYVDMYPDALELIAGMALIIEAAAATSGVKEFIAHDHLRRLSLTVLHADKDLFTWDWRTLNLAVSSFEAKPWL